MKRAEEIGNQLGIIGDVSNRRGFELAREMIRYFDDAVFGLEGAIPCATVLTLNRLPPAGYT